MGRFGFSRAFPLRPPLPGPQPVLTEAAPSPRRWDIDADEDPRFPLFLPALTALGRANRSDSCHQSVTIFPGFALSCTRPTALSDCGCQEATSITLTKETRSPNSLTAPVGAPTHAPGTKHFAFYSLIYSSQNPTFREVPSSSLLTGEQTEAPTGSRS